MPPGIKAVRILFWLVFKSIKVVYLPICIAKIFKQSKICPPIGDELLLLSASDLAEKIRTRQITCERVINTYISRIQEVNPVLNAIIEDRFEAALEDAKKVDELLRDDTMSIDDIKEKYPLLGVPVTIKGSIEVAHMNSTSGMIARADVVAERDAVAVHRVRNAGAIPLLTSNIPELCMNWECTNKLVGTTKNPHDTTRTCGGSSGGEASLLAIGASVIGIGSDIAGSLRLPAHFCGVWGHKPTSCTVSNVGHYPSCEHEDVWNAAFTLGPMARYAGDLRLLLQVLAEPQFKSQLKLDQPVDVKAIRVFYLEDIQSPLTSKVSNECLDALHSVLEHFDQICQVTCEKVDLPLMKYAPELTNLALLDIDDVDNLFAGRGDGSFAELFKYLTCRSKSTFTSIFYGVARKVSAPLPRSTLLYCARKLDELKQEFERILGEDGVFLVPAFTDVAHHHGEIFGKIMDTSYLSVFNAIGLPVTCCPVKLSKDGLPVGIQVVAAPFNDRLALAVACEIENTFGGWQAPKNSRPMNI